MLSLQEVHQYGTELEQWLRMRVHPIAIKMLKSKAEVPEGAIIPTRDWGHKYALCQSYAKSQRVGLGSDVNSGHESLHPASTNPA